MTNLVSLAPAVLICLAPAAVILAQAPPVDDNAQGKADPAKIEFFEKKIRPLLAANCFKCHGLEESEAGLRLDSQAAILRGGDSGPAIDLKEVGESLLLKAVRHTPDAIAPMPPDNRLKAEEVAALAAWVKMGAPWPQLKRTAPENAAQNDDVPLFSEDEKIFWSFLPVADPPAPAVKNHRWAKSDLDYFILATLEEKGLQPAPPADSGPVPRSTGLSLSIGSHRQARP